MFAEMGQKSSCVHLKILPLFVVDHDLVPLVHLQPHRLEGELLEKLHPSVPLLLHLRLVAHLGASSNCSQICILEIILEFSIQSLIEGPHGTGGLNLGPRLEGRIDGPQITWILLNY